MVKRSAGILIYRTHDGNLEVLLVHPGGPYWRKRDVGAWQIPKGLIEDDESAMAAACRETEEELGVKLLGSPVHLATIQQAGGKVVEAFALEQDIDPGVISSNAFDLEWPKGSGSYSSFPEIDSARWLALDDARQVVLKSQIPLLDALCETIR